MRGVSPSLWLTSNVDFHCVSLRSLRCVSYLPLLHSLLALYTYTTYIPAALRCAARTLGCEARGDVLSNYEYCIARLTLRLPPAARDARPRRPLCGEARSDERSGRGGGLAAKAHRRAGAAGR